MRNYTEQDINNYLAIREQTKQNYLNNRNTQIAKSIEINNRQNQLLRQTYANNLYSDFSQGNSRHLKRRLTHGEKALPIIYNWLNAYRK